MARRDPFRTVTAPGRRAARATWVWASGVVGWVLASAAGVFWLNTPADPGVAASPPSDWPAESALPHAADRPTLLVFVHPHCPCTRRTLTELSRITAAHPDRASVVAVLYSPDGASADWSDTDARARAAGIPGLTAVADDFGDRERQRFGVSTSGQVVLYDAAGRLLFRGGITPAGEHAGPNPGRAVVEAVLRGEPPPAADAPVFGCGMTPHARAGGL